MRKTTLFLLLTLLCSTFGFAQFPEGFESAVPPTGWTSFRGANDEGTAQDWTQSTLSNTGDAAAFVRYENVANEAQDWLVTPQFTPTSATNVLEFFQRQAFTSDFGSVYDVLVSETSQTDISSFVVVDTQTEGDFGLSYAPHYVDLSSYNDTPIFLAFRMTNDDGDNWYVDDVNLVAGVSAPDCASNPSPADGATGVAVPGGDLTVTWDAPTTGDPASAYEFYLGTMSGDLSLIATVSEPSIDLINVAFSTTYYWQVVPTNNGGAATGCPEWSFTSEDPPPPPANDDCANATTMATLPFTEDLDATSATNNDGFIVVTDCGFGMNDGVWYTFNPAEAGTVSIEITNVVGWDPELLIVSGSCGAFVCVDQADAGGTGDDESLIDVPVEANTTYYINVGHWSSSTDSPEGPFTITVSGAITLGLDDNGFSNFSYYPNPVKDVLNINGGLQIDQVIVYDILGKEVLRNEPSDFNIELDMNPLKTGVYFIRVVQGDAVDTIRIVKE